MNKIFFIIIAITVSNCESNTEVKPGQVKHIPFSHLVAVGTDSTIVIIDRNSGKVTETINRQNKVK